MRKNILINLMSPLMLFRTNTNTSSSSNHLFFFLHKRVNKKIKYGYFHLSLCTSSYGLLYFSELMTSTPSYRISLKTKRETIK